MSCEVRTSARETLPSSKIRAIPGAGGYLRLPAFFRNPLRLQTQFRDAKFGGKVSASIFVLVIKRYAQLVDFLLL